MKPIPNNLIQALNAKNYHLFMQELTFMTCETEWPGIEIKYHDDGDWGDDHYKSYDTFVPDWSPLALAACSLDENATDLVLKRWPDTNLVSRTVKSLKYALSVQSKFNGFVQEPYFNFKRALSIVFCYAEKHIIGIQLDYSSTDKIDMRNYLSEKINQIESIDSLIEFYNEHIDKDYISQHRHACFDNLYSFFTGKPKYPNSKINFIRSVQERALALVSQEHQSNVNVLDECQQLLASEIFSKEHDKCGMVGPHVRETISFVASQVTNPEVVMA